MNEIITLSRNELDIINKIISLGSKRTGLELLLVSSGAKTGDGVGKSEKNAELIIKRMSDLSEIETINKEKIVYYYNPKLADKEVITHLTNYTTEDFQKEIKMSVTNSYPKEFKKIEYYMGMIYGYPKCCINAYVNKTSMNKLMPFSEHAWCTRDCKESIEIQKGYIKAIDENIPGQRKLLACLSE